MAFISWHDVRDALKVGLISHIFLTCLTLSEMVMP